jgi:predicted RNA-binding Zn-ribbon protein involved in translation (DUF1610 family)
MDRGEFAVLPGLTTMVKKERALTRFRCGHCGSRLIMHDRHLGRVVACHACGRATHPLARRLASLLPSASAAPAAAARKSRATAAAAAAVPARPKSPTGRRGGPACANCGQSIGKLQARRLWRDETVCQPCFATLDVEASQLVPAAPVRAVPAGRPARVARVVRDDAGPAAPDLPGLELSAAPLAPVLLVGAACVGFFLALSVMSYAGGFVVGLALVGVAVVGVRLLRRGTSSVRARFEHIAALRRRHGTPHVIAMLLAWCRAQPAGRLPYALLLLLFWGAMYVPYRLGGLLLHGSRPGSAVVRLPA